MKHLRVLILFLLIIPSSLHAQTGLPHLTAVDITSNLLPATPRQRVSRNTVLALTDQWQTIALSTIAPYDVSSFTVPRWDATNSRIVFDPAMTIEQAYDLSFDYQITNVKGSSKVQLRFAILAPTPLYFPFPEDLGAGYVDMAEINMPGIFKRHFSYSVYTSTNIRAYGIQIQMRAISYIPNTNLITGLIANVLTVLAGTDRVNLNLANLNIYAK